MIITKGLKGKLPSTRNMKLLRENGWKMAKVAKLYKFYKGDVKILFHMNRNRWIIRSTSVQENKVLNPRLDLKEINNFIKKHSNQNEKS